MLARHIDAKVIESLKFFPIVAVIGGRQVGKSTLLSHLKNQSLIRDIYTLDDPGVLASARHDPLLFLKSIKTPIAIDEIQRCPDLIVALKKIVDERQRPGEFVITGSANLLSYPDIKESLIGRVNFVTMEGLSASEMQQLPYHSLWSKLIDPQNLNLSPFDDNAFDFVKKSIFFGSYPRVRLNESEFFKENWFGTYQAGYIEKDVRDLSKFIDTIGFSKTFALAGMRSGNLLSYHGLANDVGIDQRTLKRYMEILTLTFQLLMLHPWHVNNEKKLIKTSKVYMNDTAHVCHLLGLHRLEDMSPPHLGNLFETWVFSEIRKTLHLETGVHVYFYRAHNGSEVDFVLQNGMHLIPIECKAKTALTPRDFRGLAAFLEKHTCPHGYIFYLGEKILKLKNNITAVPASILWGHNLADINTKQPYLHL
jgi:predicted AAA+ superfamily ATPase